MKTELTVFENLRFWKDFLEDFRGAAGISIDEAAEIIGLAGITTCPTVICPPVNSAVSRWQNFSLHGAGVDSRRTDSRARQGGRRHVYRSCERPFIEGRHRDCCDTSALGLTDARELQMTGFAGVEAWA